MGSLVAYIKSLKRDNIKWICLVWLTIIFILSAIPTTGTPKFSWSNIYGVDKIAHFVMYFSLSILIYFSLDISKIHHRYVILWSFGLSSLYGLLMEVFQHFFFANRSFDILDIIFNISGALIGVIICNFIAKTY